MTPHVQRLVLAMSSLALIYALVSSTFRSFCIFLAVAWQCVGGVPLVAEIRPPPAQPTTANNPLCHLVQAQKVRVV